MSHDIVDLKYDMVIQKSFTLRLHIYYEYFYEFSDCRNDSYISNGSMCYILEVMMRGVAQA